jgi:hypothetical protein
MIEVEKDTSIIGCGTTYVSLPLEEVHASHERL